MDKTYELRFLYYLSGNSHQRIIMAMANICSLFSVLIHITRQKVIHCPAELCKCTYDEAICSGKNLTYIPRFPRGVQSATFLNGDIGTLSKESIKNLTFNVIFELKFINNSIDLILMYFLLSREYVHWVFHLNHRCWR